MSTLLLSGVIAAQNRLSADERGQATAEYGTVILIAVALGMAVLALVTGNKFDGPLHAMIEKVLKVATGWIS
jgi:Flp pilus assembly pilin Flp